MTESVELTPRQNAILDYIRNTSNSLVKERIIEHLTKDGKGSRKTILKDIKQLEEYGMVYIDKEKPNSQIHYVRIQNKSVLLSVMENIKNLRDAFFLILDASKIKFDELNEIIESNDAEEGEDRAGSLQVGIVHAEVSLQRLFQHSFGMYVLYSLFVWPKEVNDKKTLDKIYTVVLNGLKEIQMKFAEIFGEKSESAESIVGDIIKELFVLKPDNLYSTIINLEYVGLGEYGEAVLDPLWEFGFRFVPQGLLDFHELNEEGKRDSLAKIEGLKDWRDIVSRRVDKLPPSAKDWARAVSDKY
jgi:Fe2+ or Zn2+ uptake regulation protein